MDGESRGLYNITAMELPWNWNTTLTIIIDYIYFFGFYKIILHPGPQVAISWSDRNLIWIQYQGSIAHHIRLNIERIETMKAKSSKVTIVTLHLLLAFDMVMAPYLYNEFNPQRALLHFMDNKTKYRKMTQSVPQRYVLSLILSTSTCAPYHNRGKVHMLYHRYVC